MRPLSEGFDNVEKLKRNTKHKNGKRRGWAKLERVKTECIRGNLKNGDRDFVKFI